jgi:hypothetical protein
LMKKQKFVSRNPIYAHSWIQFTYRPRYKDAYQYRGIDSIQKQYYRVQILFFSFTGQVYTL